MAKGGLFLEQLQDWRPLDALGAASGTEKYLVIILSGSTCRTWPSKPKHKWQLLLLICSSPFARQRDHNGWAHTCHSNTRVCWGQCSEVASEQHFGWAWDENHVRGINFTVQSRKGQSDRSAHVWIFLTVFFLFSCGFLPLHVSRPPGRAVQNKGAAPVATTPLPAAFQAIFHPLAQRYCPLNEHKSFSLLIFNETQTDPLHWTTTHPGTRERKQAPSTNYLYQILQKGQKFWIFSLRHGISPGPVVDKCSQLSGSRAG